MSTGRKPLTTCLPSNGQPLADIGANLVFIADTASSVRLPAEGVHDYALKPASQRNDASSNRQTVWVDVTCSVVAIRLHTAHASEVSVGSAIAKRSLFPIEKAAQCCNTERIE